MGIDGINQPSNLKMPRLYNPQTDHTDAIERVNEQLKSAKGLGRDTYEKPDILAKTAFSVAGHEGTMQINTELTFDVHIPGVGKGTFQAVPDGKGGADLKATGTIDPALEQKIDENPVLKTALGLAYLARTLDKGGTIPVYKKELAKDINLRVEAGKDRIGFNISGTF